MKLITAIIQPDVLQVVHQALINSGIERITVSRCSGHGQQDDINIYRGQEVTPDLLPKVRIDVACNNKFTEKTVNAILNSARHGNGQVGDGKIFIRPLDDCIRIRTGERGTNAI